MYHLLNYISAPYTSALKCILPLIQAEYHFLVLFISLLHLILEIVLLFKKAVDPVLKEQFMVKFLSFKNNILNVVIHW